jgi:WD40 repeat protein
MLATGSNQRVILWDVTQPGSAEQLGQPLTGHIDTVFSIAFSPDGQTMATGSADKRVILWDMDPESWKAKACRKANRKMSEAEWRRFMGERPYRKTCPELP